MINHELVQQHKNDRNDAEVLSDAALETKAAREQAIAQVMARVAARNAHEDALEQESLFLMLED